MIRRVKHLLFNRKTLEKYPVNGCIRSTTTIEAVPIENVISEGSEEIPRAVDLRPFMSEIETQWFSNSCVANALAGAYEYLLRRENNDETDMSRLFIYYNARVMDPTFAGEISDEGSMISYAIEAIKTHGTCTEAKWKFEKENVDQKPTDECFEEAKNFLVHDVIEVGLNLKNMKTCLARGFPFVFCLKLFKSFEVAADNKGYVSIPKPGEAPFPLGDYHAMLAVGYNDDRQVFVIRNSWGKNWGDAGHCFIPYPYMIEPEYCCEVFAIRKLGNFELPRDHWLEDPSQMEMNVPEDLGGAEDGESNWEIIEEGSQQDLNSNN